MALTTINPSPPPTGDKWSVAITRMNAVIQAVNKFIGGSVGQVFKKTSSSDFFGAWEDDYSLGVQTNDTFNLKYKVFDATAISIIDPNYDTGFTLTGVDISISNIVSFTVSALVASGIQNTQFICNESGLDLVFMTVKTNGWDTTGVTYPLGDVKVYIVEKV
jgi:hypothetical protein